MLKISQNMFLEVRITVYLSICVYKNIMFK